MYLTDKRASHTGIGEKPNATKHDKDNYVCKLVVPTVHSVSRQPNSALYS